MNIIAYQYEADTHCIPCTVKRFDYLRTSKRDYISFKSMCDENRIHVNQIDSTDEWQELDESFLSENPTQWLACGDCHKIIETFTIDRVTGHTLTITETTRSF